MSNIQESITSVLQERNTRKHLALVVCMIAVATVLAVFWSLHLNGITMSSGDLICGKEEHTHTTDCYAWVPVDDDTEVSTEPEESVTGTESVTDTETATESVQIESGTEEGSEEDTESPQVGDTKIINGVEYVYSLICGKEEHIHTDDCYSEDSTDTEITEATEETISEEDNTEELSVNSGTAGAGSILKGGRSIGGSGGEVSAVSLTAGNSASYLFADTLSLSNAVNALDEEYIVYTILGNKYYLVKSDGTLVPCDDLSSQTDSEKVSSSSSDGTYYWGVNSDYTNVFKLTSLSSLAFEDYCWTLDSTGNSDSSGNGEYTIYNEESGNYLAPTNGVNEELTGTAWWTGYEAGTKYSLESEKVLEFTITCTEEVNGYAAFSLNILDSAETKILRTGSDKNAYYEQTSSITGDTVTGAATTLSSDIISGITYTVTVVRTDTVDDGTGQITYSSYTIIYYDETNKATLVEAIATNTNLTDETVYVQVLAQVGTFDVSVAYENKIDKDNIINADCSDLTIGSESSTEINPDLDPSVRTGEQSLTGDFDITYSFSNKNSSRTKYTAYYDWNYVLGFDFEDGTSVYLYASGEGDATSSSKTSKLTRVTGNSATSIIESSTSTWTNVLGKWNGGWIMDMYYGCDCTINIVRSGDLITVNAVIKYYGSTISTCVTTFECSQDVDVYLTGIGNTCTLSNISLVDNTPDYEVYDYAAYSIVTTDEEGLYLSASGTYGWTGYDGELTSNPSLITASDGSTVNWVSLTTGTTYYLARVRSYKVYFDATNGATSNYASMTSEQVSTTTTDESGDCWVTVPTATFNDGSYTNGYTKYTLRGWQDIYGINTSVNGTSYYNMIDTTTNSTYESIYAYGTGAVDYTGQTIQIVGHTVFYADWYVTDADYVIANGSEDGTLDDAAAANNSNTVDAYGYGKGAVDTSSFVTTYVFDYNDLFNELSTVILSDSNYASSLTASSHTEYWALVGGTSYNDGKSILDLTSLKFAFFNSYGNGNGSTLSRLTRDATSLIGSVNYTTAEATAQNGSRSYRTAGILGTTASTETLIEYLFSTKNAMNTATNTTDAVLGKTYVGEGNYLYQYNEKNGYYYYDSIKNAASYDSANDRFYLYDYTVRMTKNLYGNDSVSSADFLPFNYVEQNGSDTYIYTNAINYWFGMNTNIEFTLPEAVGTTTNKTNQTTAGDMVFKFVGDDDLWIYIDDCLVLDVGGIHGEVYGEINFSNGLVTIVNNLEDTFYYIEDSNGATLTDGDGNIYISSVEATIDAQITTLQTANPSETYTKNNGTGLELFITEDSYGLYQITDYAYDSGSVEQYSISGENGYTSLETGVELSSAQVDKVKASGAHTLSMYYLERGASEVNLASYWNISSTYNLTLSKADANVTTQELYNAEFTIYEISDITGFASSSYDSLADYLAGEATKVGTYYTNDNDANANDGNEVVTVTGLQPRHTYYIVETEAPEGYPLPGKVIELYMGSSGDLIIRILDEDGSELEQYTFDVSEQDAEKVTSPTGNAFVLFDSITDTYDTAESVYKVAFTILNTYVYELATTGSTGTTQYLVVGQLLVIIAGFGFIIIALYHFVWIRRLRTIAYKKEYTEEKEKRQKCFARMRGHPRERSITRGHARDRPVIRGAASEHNTMSSAYGSTERSRGTGPGG